MDLQTTCNKIAKQLELNPEFVKEVVKFQFQFIADVMKDDNDFHDILINKLFKFKLKSKYKKHENNLH